LYYRRSVNWSDVSYERFFSTNASIYGVLAAENSILTWERRTKAYSGKKIFWLLQTLHIKRSKLFRENYLGTQLSRERTDCECGVYVLVTMIRASTALHVGLPSGQKP
jgi:hypothetical protein